MTRSWNLQVAQSVSVWKQRLVITAAAVPQDVIHALLTAGASAVICWDATSGPLPLAAEAAAYFSKFYAALFSEGASVSAAMDAAGTSAFFCTAQQQNVNTKQQLQSQSKAQLCCMATIDAHCSLCHTAFD